MKNLKLQNVKQNIYIGTNDFLNACRVAACFVPTERQFQSFAPLKEKHFWPFVDFLMGASNLSQYYEGSLSRDLSFL